MLNGSSWKIGNASALRCPKIHTLLAAVPKQCCAGQQTCARHTANSTPTATGSRESAQADAERRQEEEEARYLSCTLLPAPDDARGLAAFLAAARPDPALYEPAAMLASCQALHDCATLTRVESASRS